MRSTLPACLPVLLAVAGCEPSPLVVGEGDTAVDSESPLLQPVSGVGTFPAERDLAILLPLEETPHSGVHPHTQRRCFAAVHLGAHDRRCIRRDPLRGCPPRREHLRRLAPRIGPCRALCARGPLPSPGPRIRVLAMVRLVWQPVVPGVNIWGVELDAYGDDRAIHAVWVQGNLVKTPT